MTFFKFNFKKNIVYAIEYVLYKLGVIYLFEKFVKLKPGIIILFYHRLSDINEKNIHPDSIRIDIFKKHMKYLNKNYTFISLNQALNLLRSKRVLDKNYIVVSFDDGYKSVLDFWDDELENINISPVIYLVTENISNKTPLWTDRIDYFIYMSKGKKEFEIVMGKEKYEFMLNSYDERKKAAEFLKNKLKKMDCKDIERNVNIIGKKLNMNEVNIKFDLLDWEQVKRLQDMNFDIGSHTMRHYNLNIMDDKTRKREIIESYEEIYRNIGVKQQNFSYPFGRYDEETIKCVKKIYNSATTVIQGINYTEDNLFELKRISGGNIDVHVLISRIIKERIKGSIN